jgi:hypothetical protein
MISGIDFILLDLQQTIQDDLLIFFAVFVGRHKSNNIFSYSIFTPIINQSHILKGHCNACQKCSWYCSQFCRINRFYVMEVEQSL